MNTLNALAYGGIAVLVILLIIFEVKDGCLGYQQPHSTGYEYYTAGNRCVKICKRFGSLYKVYVNSNCPYPQKRDRYGQYITIRARSASDAERIIDDMFS